MTGKADSLGPALSLLADALDTAGRLAEACLAAEAATVLGERDAGAMIMRNAITWDVAVRFVEPERQLRADAPGA